MFDDKDHYWKKVNIDDLASLFLEMEKEISPYLEFINLHKRSGRFNPGALMVPINAINDPDMFYENTGSRSEGWAHKVTDYETYWESIVTSDDGTQVVALLPKQDLPEFTALKKLTELIKLNTGLPVSLKKGLFLSAVAPQFSWPLHTDGYPRRIHIPLQTNEQSGFVWAETIKSKDYVEDVRMKKGEVYIVRTDRPHTIYNHHPTDIRVHLIYDSREDIDVIYDGDKNKNNYHSNLS